MGVHDAARGAWLALVLPGIGLLGCAGATASTPPHAQHEPADPERVPSADEDVPAPTPCPVLDFDQPDRLEPPDPPPDGRDPVPLAELVRAAEPRAAATPAPEHRLGQIDVHPVGGTPRVHSNVGMGWVWLEPAEVRSGLPASVRQTFEAWVQARTRWADRQRARYLIDQRVRYLETMPRGPSAWGDNGWRCSTAAQVDLRLELEAARRALHAREAALAEALRRYLDAAPRTTPPNPSTAWDTKAAAYARFVLAMLETGPQARGPRDEGRATFHALAEDPTLDPELRARSYRELARTSPDVYGPEFARALEAAVALSTDPELQIAAQLKLAQVEPDPRRRRAMQRAIVNRIEAAAGDEASADEDWRVGMLASHLAELSLELGDFTDAVAWGTRCARASRGHFTRDDDPWGCAMDTATALVELGADRVPELQVPARFVGPLGLAWTRAALRVHDRDQARHVAAAAIARAPLAAEAPELLRLQIGLCDDAACRSALEDRLERDYAPDGEWWRHHRARLAWREEPAGLATRLDELRNPTRLANTSTPHGGAEISADLRQRAAQSAAACIEHFDAPGDAVTVTVDTRGPTPDVRVRGRTTQQKACVRQRARARFWSVGPARVRFTLAVPED